MARRGGFPGGMPGGMPGNMNNIINMYDDAHDIKYLGKNNNYRLRDSKYYFIEGLSWSDVSTSNISIRYVPVGYLFDAAGPMVFFDGSKEFLFFQALLNSNSAGKIFSILSPGMHYSVEHIAKFPIIKVPYNQQTFIVEKVKKIILLSKIDWDSFETSWDFSIHPLLDEKIGKREDVAFEKDSELIDYLGEDKYNEIFNNEIKACAPIEFAYLRYKDWANKAFFHLKKNEEDLNRIFIDIYGLNDELKPEEDDSMVSVHRIFDDKSEIPESMKKGQYALTREDVVKAFISYVVGCMFGRYDADRPGLAYAGGDFDISTYSGEHGLVPDSDNVIPILGDSWFKNDAETYFIKFVENQFGHEKLNENLKFIENALGKSIRDYFYKDFYKNHLKTYQKRPIYWMFSSPKGYFQALVYMHRYNENTANAVLDCLRQFRDKIRLQIKLAEEARQTRKKVEYENIDNDLNDYEMNILYPLAIQHLTFDLDDGVKVNYEKLGKALKAIK